MPLLGEVAGILVHAYADPFHEMIKAAATATGKLAAALPHGALETHLTSLIKVRTPHLRLYHRREHPNTALVSLVSTGRSSPRR